MIKWMFFILIIISFTSIAEQKNQVHWSNLAMLNPTLIEQKAKDYLLDQIPELKNAEIKLAQIDAQYFKGNPSLEVIFVHSNSLKPMSQNKTLGSSELYGIKYYMESLRVKFSLDGAPTEIQYQESLMGKTKKESQERFTRHFNNY
jgi:hypothetical protein